MLQEAPSSDVLEFKKLYSNIQQYENAMDIILKSISSRAMETCGTLVLAPPGVGKSRMVEKILDDYHEESTAEKENVFGIYIEIPDTSMNEFYRELLFKLKDKEPDYGTAAAKKRRVINLINNMDVKFVFLDEIQVALPSSGLLPTSKFVKNIKELMNKTTCAWILLGAPEAIAIIDVDDQLADRFPRVINLKGLSLLGEENSLDFIDYLTDLLEDFPRRAPYFKFINDSRTDDSLEYSENVNYDNLLRLCLASLGKPRRIRDLIISCLDNTQPDERITNLTFSKAYAECYPDASDREYVNPFETNIRLVKNKLKEHNLYE